MALADNVLQLLKANGDRVADAARKADLPYATLHDITTGKAKRPSAEILGKLAAAYGFTAEQLLSDNFSRRLRDQRVRVVKEEAGLASGEIELFGNFDDVVRHLRGVAPPGQSKARKLAAVEGIERTATALGWTLPDWFFDLRRQIDDGEL